MLPGILGDVIHGSTYLGLAPGDGAGGGVGVGDDGAGPGAGAGAGGVVGGAGAGVAAAGGGVGAAGVAGAGGVGWNAFGGAALTYVVAALPGLKGDRFPGLTKPPDTPLDEYDQWGDSPASASDWVPDSDFKMDRLGD